MKHDKPPRLDSMQKRYTVRVGDDEDKRIKEYCERTGRNRSDLFREAVQRLIAADKE